MKIEVEIPDKYKDRNVWIFAGIEPVAFKLFDNQKWKVKTGDCSTCGKCCQNLDNDKWPFKIIDGVCEHLERRPGKKKTYLCRLNINRPFGCCIGLKKIPECTVEFEVV